MAANPGAGRAAFTAGLRELADYLDANPDVPAPYWAKATFFPGGSDADQIAEVDRVATHLGVEPSWRCGTQYVVSRSFGPITFEAVVITEAERQEWAALTSYRGSVQPAGGAS